MRAQPWLSIDEFNGWKERWKTLILGALDAKFEFERHDGWFEMEWGHGADRMRFLCGLRLIMVDGAAGRGGEDDYVHLRVRVAKGARATASDTPYGGVEMAYGASSDDVDMLLSEHDLTPHDTGGGVMQTRAIHEFARYLGCRSLAYESLPRDAPRRRDMMAGGDELKPWHAWPWWRRLDHHHTDAPSHGRVVFRAFLVERGIRDGATAFAMHEDVGTRDESQQQALLRGEEGGWRPNDNYTVIKGILLGSAALFTLGGLLLAEVEGAIDLFDDI